jgi:DNA-binding CsgD family transcriptional regulator
LAMVLLNDADRGEAIEPENLEGLYDLTPAQARLLVALVEGRRLADYAEEAGVSINTVKSHMKQIFEKTGENRQTDLVRRVLADPLSRRS